jgi:orotate phosphoribosyltransferase-like protein
LDTNRGTIPELTMIEIKLGKKFAEKDVDQFIDKIFRSYQANQNEQFLFDLTEVEYITNQELLVFTAVLKLLIEQRSKFKVLFFKPAVSTNEIPLRVKRQIIQIWEVWQIWRIFPSGELKQYFGIDRSSVELLQRETGYYPSVSELYTRHGITPFVSLDFINNYNENEIQGIISQIYTLNRVVEKLLKSNNCSHPFTSKAISTIITEELYLNFLDHAIRSSFLNAKLMAFMSLSFQAKLDEQRLSPDQVQSTKKINFESESIDETIDFYYDRKKKQFKNHSYIQFSFLDFGEGVVRTLVDEFVKINGVEKERVSHSEVLKFAFRHDSSRHPISSNVDKERTIPRGLFDALSIVQRYKGLLVARSNHGKILFDFSSEKDPEKACKYFGDPSLFFPGTLISIYLPAIENVSSVEIGTIKPVYILPKATPRKRNSFNLNALVGEHGKEKQVLYNELLSNLKKAIGHSVPSLNIISFRQSHLIDRRLVKKIIYFLLSDYEVNFINNVILIDFEDFELLSEIESEIIALDQAIRNYKIHPLPIVNYDKGKGTVSLFWLGIFDDNDKKKLVEILYDTFSIARSDLNDPMNISGHLLSFDRYGNLVSNFPNENELKDFFHAEERLILDSEVQRLLQKHACFRPTTDKTIYLCNGNYYQKEYIQLNNLLNDKHDCSLIAGLLFNELRTKVPDFENYRFVGISSASQKIFKAWVAQEMLTTNDYVILDNINSGQGDLDLNFSEQGKKYVLVSDVLSTGYLTVRLNDKLKEYNSSIAFIAVIVSIVDLNFAPTKALLESYQERIITLMDRPIHKFLRKDIQEELVSKEIIRINPYTNIPITLSINETNFNETVIFTSKVKYLPDHDEITVQNEFLSFVKPEDLRVGFLKFNNVIHPYFFDTVSILNQLTEALLRSIFDKMGIPELYNEPVKLFYPRKSGIEKFDFSILRKALTNHEIEEIAIERISTTEGWRFPHNTDYLSTKIEDNVCLILDDGSCTGDSLIQMIDEISFYNAKKIVLLCIIGRVNDHKREFFSRLSDIKVKDGKTIGVRIFFTTHWHIPTYYVDENPNTRETIWLNELIHLQNTPRSIKKIASNILSEISAKTESEFTDFKYLPKVKIGESMVIPKRDLLLLREEIGKVIGYRLYKESFVFFNAFVRKYETKVPKKGRFKEMELLCATFLVEPYLYKKIIDVLPDVVELIEEFVRVLLFSNPKVFELLTYQWNKRDILHLFFIVFSDEKLLQELSPDRFDLLISFTQPKESALSYILYKLLNYFPLNVDQLKTKKFDREIKDLIANLNEKDTNPGKEIKRFYAFTSTLPSRVDFHSQLSTLRDNYRKQIGPQLHDEKLSFNHNISLILAKTRQCQSLINDAKKIDQDKITAIKKAWFDILEFITPILSFSISFPEFLIPYPYFKLYNKLENGSKSLRTMVGENEDIIFALSETFVDLEKLKLVEKNLESIQSDFEVNSMFYELVDKPETNLNSFINEFRSELQSLKQKLNINPIEIDAKLRIAIPQYYASQLIIKELIANFKNHSLITDTSTIEIKFTFETDTLFKMNILNNKSENNTHKSTGEGIKCLKLLTESNLFGFKYYSKSVGDQYYQELNFSIF